MALMTLQKSKILVLNTFLLKLAVQQVYTWQATFVGPQTGHGVCSWSCVLPLVGIFTRKTWPENSYQFHNAKLCFR